MILDTNALSAFIDGDESVARILRAQSRAAIPVITLGEFMYGIAASRYRKTYEGWLDAHLMNFELLPLTADTAREYAAVRGALKRAGRPIPAHDAWIAALSFQHRLAVLSRDAHFAAVPHLRCVRW